MANNIGEPKRLQCTFTNFAGVLSDPTTIKFEITPPTGTMVTKTYALAEIQKSSTGVFYFDYMILEAGKHWWKVTTTGDPAVVEQHSFYVETNHVPRPS